MIDWHLLLVMDIGDTYLFVFLYIYFAAFGLTVVEAMTCGLPTFATNRGGPAEIIKHKKSGYHIDPYHGEQASDLMADFFNRCLHDESYWETISKVSYGSLRNP